MRPAEAGPDGRTEFRRLTFQGGGLAEAGGRPRRSLLPHAVEFRAASAAWSRVDRCGADAADDLRRDDGRLFQLAVRLPADWDVDRVDLAPEGLMRNWAVRTENNARVLVVDLQKALTPAVRGTKLTVELRPARPGEVLRKELPFPDAEPVGARFREGAGDRLRRADASAEGRNRGRGGVSGGRRPLAKSPSIVLLSL